MYRTTNDKIEVRRLKDDLFWIRYDLLHIMPKEIFDILGEGCTSNSKIKMIEWQKRAVEKVLAFAEKLPPVQSSPTSDRVYCPLCGQGSTSPGDKGFSLPIGLKRHLEGFGNSRQCVVMKAAVRISEHAEFDFEII